MPFRHSLISACPHQREHAQDGFVVFLAGKLREPALRDRIVEPRRRRLALGRLQIAPVASA